MEKQAIDRLVRFCASQSDHFNPQEWLSFSGVDNKTVALAARYLSMTSWYGHEDDLVRIADAMAVDLTTSDSAGLYLESRALNFNLPYFSVAVRSDIATTQVVATGSGSGNNGVAQSGQPIPAWRQRRRFDRALPVPQ